MKTSIFEIRLRYRKVRFYTVHVENSSLPEFNDFVRRMTVKCPHKLGELLKFIEEVGENYGAEERLFRHERNSHALPPHYVDLGDDDDEEGSRYGLRLYCCRFTPEIVFLYNGDLKTAQYPDLCPNVAKYFKFALRATKAIDEAMRDGYIQFDGFDVLIDEDFVLEI